MTKSQAAMAAFRASEEYTKLVQPTDEKSKAVGVADLEVRIRRAFAAGWIHDRVNLSSLLDEIAGSAPVAAKK